MSRLAQLNNLISSQTASINSCAAEIAELRKEDEELRSKFNHLEEKVSSSDFSNDDVHYEILDRVKHQKNVIVLSLQERNLTEDECYLKSILDSGCPDISNYIHDFCRIGKKILH